MAKTLKITLKRSVNGIKEKQRATVKALGLKKIGQTVEKEDCATVRGMINVVNHLVDVEEA